MKKLIFFLFSILFGSSLHGQQMVNYNFATVIPPLPTDPCTPSGYYTIVGGVLPNWFVTSGNPRLNIASPSNYLDIGSQVGSTIWESFAGNYHFIAGHTYILRITMPVFFAGNGCANELKVVAANGLSAITPVCAAAPLPTPVSSELIGTYSSFTTVYNKTYTVTYTPSTDFYQVYFYTVPCGNINNYSEVQISSVSIQSCGYGSHYYKSTNDLFGGVQVIYSSITAGVDPGIVTLDPSNNTIFEAESITLVPNFSADIHQGSFFLAEPFAGCVKDPCHFDGVRCIPVGGSAVLTPNLSGGVWTSSDPSYITVDPDGTIHGIAITPPYPFIFITYSIYGCESSLDFMVSDNCGNGGKPGGNVDPALASSATITVSPNPSNDIITISYPCKNAGVLNLAIKDASGRLMREESIDCTENSTISHTADISAYPAGLYFISLTLNDQQIVKKIVKL